MSPLIAYSTLFVIAFLSGSILPLQSEAWLSGLLISHTYSVVLLVLVASLGNILGSVVNWYLGYGITRLEGKRWFPVKRHTLVRAEGWYHRYGKWTLLLSWVPILGDPLTIVAGVMREPLPIFLLLVTIAKTSRYIVLALIVQGWF